MAHSPVKDCAAFMVSSCGGMSFLSSRSTQSTSVKYLHYVQIWFRGADMTNTTSSRALYDISVERQRQIEEEGWTPEHDDRHANGELACAAACYVIGDAERWPWHKSWWKPRSRRSNLVRAAALIVAEIERLDRAAPPRPPDPPIRRRVFA